MAHIRGNALHPLKRELLGGGDIPVEDETAHLRESLLRVGINAVTQSARPYRVLVEPDELVLGSAVYHTADAPVAHGKGAVEVLGRLFVAQ